MKFLHRYFLFGILLSGICVPSTSPHAETTVRYRSVAGDHVSLLGGLFADRAELNRQYMLSLTNENLLQNHYFEAGLRQYRLRESARFSEGTSHDDGDDMHWGWEAPTSFLRGHFLGHWMSAAAWRAAYHDDDEAARRLNDIIVELAKCQDRNGGQWVGSIPEKYMDLLAQGTPPWVPQYVVHKTFMGLLDAYEVGGNKQALVVAIRFADWFYEWSGRFSREEFDTILDVETGAMLEVFATLYGITGDSRHYELMERYDRPRLFEPLLNGQDVLTNYHANTTIPEAHGAAKAYEVTGEMRWRDITEAYWKCAVTDRGCFCTGGQTSGEHWTPPFKFASRLAETNQEHCSVYNMIRLADYLFRWTGDAVYADYIEQNLYNGILAHQHPQTGQLSYFMPMRPGSKKTWSHPTHDFFCCHGSMVQAHSCQSAWIYYEHEKGVRIAQYIPSKLSTEYDGTGITISQTVDAQEPPGHDVRKSGPAHRPMERIVEIAVDCDSPVNCIIDVRIPWWVRGKPVIMVNGEPVEVTGKGPRFISISRRWSHDRVRIVLPYAITACPLPDEPGTVAFMEGPVVLAGLCNGAVTLTGSKKHPETILAPARERDWFRWNTVYRTTGQQENFEFIPLYQMTDQRYTLYFPIEDN